MINNIYQKLTDYLKDCPELGNYIYFNVIPLDVDTASVNSNPASTVLNEYVDGSKEVRLLFNINIVKEYDDGGTSDLNLDAIEIFDNIIGFIEKSNNEHNFPDLGENYTVNELGATYKAPEVYITQDIANIARYEGQFYVEYLEKKRSEL